MVASYQAGIGEQVWALRFFPRPDVEESEKGDNQLLEGIGKGLEFLGLKQDGTHEEEQEAEYLLGIGTSESLQLLRVTHTHMEEHPSTDLAAFFSRLDRLNNRAQGDDGAKTQKKKKNAPLALLNKSPNYVQMLTVHRCPIAGGVRSIDVTEHVVKGFELVSVQRKFDAIDVVKRALPLGQRTHDQKRVEIHTHIAVLVSAQRNELVAWTFQALDKTSFRAHSAVVGCHSEPFISVAIPQRGLQRVLLDPVRAFLRDNQYFTVGASIRHCTSVFMWDMIVVEKEEGQLDYVHAAAGAWECQPCFALTKQQVSEEKDDEKIDNERIDGDNEHVPSTEWSAAAITENTGDTHESLLEETNFGIGPAPQDSSLQRYYLRAKKPKDNRMCESCSVS
jgi:hypothetical protein